MSKNKHLRLMYRGDLMDDFVWATPDEITEYEKKGYKLFRGLRLMYRGENDFVWSTPDKITEYEKKGYKLLR